VTLEYLNLLTLTPHKFIWGAPKILKPVLDTPFQGLLLGKVWTGTTPADLGSQRWERGLGPPNFNGGSSQNFGPNLWNYTYIRPSEL